MLIPQGKLPWALIHFYKKAAAFVLQVVGKHSPQLAQAIVDCGALNMLLICLEDFDPGVKEAAAWALGCIARHNAELSQAVVDAGAVPLLLLCIQEPEIALKRLAASILTDISKHSPELAQTVADAGAIAHLAQIILNPDVQLKVLPHNSKARPLFVISDELKKFQEIKAEPGSLLQEYINSINNCYPKESVSYYSPRYLDALLQRMDSYQPLSI